MSVLDEAFEELLDDYRQTLKARAEEISELMVLLDACGGRDPGDSGKNSMAAHQALIPPRSDLVARLGEIAHGLAGSGASFGFSEVSRVAEELRQRLRGADGDAAGSVIVISTARRLVDICRDLGEPPMLGVSATVGLSPNND